MRVVLLIKKKTLCFLVALAYLGVFLGAPDLAARSVENSVYYLVEMLRILPVIYLLTVAIEALIPREVIVRRFGETSGLSGRFLALLLGSLSAGPIYAAFPVGKMLLGKGASVANVVVILSAWAVVKVPMLVNEARFLGVPFMVARWVLTVAAIFAMASIAGRLVRNEDLPAEDAAETGILELKEACCVGCGVCVERFPEYYGMRGKKAVVRKHPEKPEALPALLRSARECPGGAIVLHRKDVP